MPSLSERLLEVSMLLRLLCRGLWCWTVVLGGVAVVSYGLRIAVVRAMELEATVLRTDVSRIIVSGAVLLVAFMVVSVVSIVLGSGAVMLGDIVLASVVSRVAVVRVVLLEVRC